MEDVFYFGDTPVALSDIEALCRACGYVCNTLKFSHGDYLRVFHGPGEREYIDVAPFGREWWGSFDPALIEKLDRMGVISPFSVTYHFHEVDELVGLLRLILDRYGGWVGCDDEMERLYTANDIGDIVGPLRTWEGLR